MRMTAGVVGVVMESVVVIVVAIVTSSGWC